MFRKDPIPGTGKWNRPFNMNWLRYFKCIMNEKRKSVIDKEYFRAARSFRNLPNPWDDFIVQKSKTRTWKNRKKRKQWMKK